MRLLLACVLGASVAVISAGCSSGTHSIRRGPPARPAPPTTTDLSGTTTAPSTASGPQAFGGAAQGPVCSSGHLALRFGDPPSPATGQNPLALVLVNVGSSLCHLDGYPRIALLDAQGQVLPFTYRQGGDQEVTSNPPDVVNLPPGAAGYVLTNKYRCDAGNKATALSMQVTPPGNTSGLSMPLSEGSRPAFCGAGDPGSTLAISPVEPNARATFAF